MAGLTIEVFDPRYDAEPDYWRRLRAEAGLRADWSWDVLTVQAWHARTPLLITVLRDGPTVHGVVHASWVGPPMRRTAYAGPGRRKLFGLLHVRAPGTGSVPGWWFRGPLRELMRDYAAGMRRELGLACRGLLLRQLAEDDLPAVRRKLALVRPTAANGVIGVDGFRSREDWTATLARKRRQDLRKIFKLYDEDPSIELHVGSGAGIDPVAFTSVVRHNELKYRRRLTPPPEPTAYFAALLRQPDVVVITYTDRDNGNLVGVLTILDHPQWPIARNWSAVPVELGGRPKLYFHWYGLAVRWAIEHGRRGLVLGRGKPELKQTLGAIMEPQYAALLPIR